MKKRERSRKGRTAILALAALVALLFVVLPFMAGCTPNTAPPPEATVSSPSPETKEAAAATEEAKRKEEAARQLTLVINREIEVLTGKGSSEWDAFRVPEVCRMLERAVAGHSLLRKWSSVVLRADDKTKLPDIKESAENAMKQAATMLFHALEKSGEEDQCRPGDDQVIYLSDKLNVAKCLRGYLQEWGLTKEDVKFSSEDLHARVLSLARVEMPELRRVFAGSDEAAQNAAWWRIVRFKDEGVSDDELGLTKAEREKLKNREGS